MEEEIKIMLFVLSVTLIVLFVIMSFIHLKATLIAYAMASGLTIFVIGLWFVAEKIFLLEV